MGGHVDSPLRRPVRALVLAAVAFGALIMGYLWGYGVGERDGLDSDPEQNTDRVTSTPLPSHAWGTNGG